MGVGPPLNSCSRRVEESKRVTTSNCLTLFRKVRINLPFNKRRQYAAEGPRDALRHGQRVSNKGGRSV